MPHDVAGHPGIVGNHGQHRNAGGGVVLAEAHCQRPVVRRGPEEDDSEQDQGRPGQRTGNGGPADEYRHTSGSAAPHDVLRGASLQNHGVNNDVEENRDEAQERGDPVHEEPEPQHGDRTQDETENYGRAGGDFTCDEGATLRAMHHDVDMAVEIAAQCVPGSGGPSTAHPRGHYEPNSGSPALRPSHRGQLAYEPGFTTARLGYSYI